MTAHGIWVYSRHNPFAGHGKVYTWVRLGLELLMVLMWIGSATLMLRPKGEVCGSAVPDELRKRPLISYIGLFADPQSSSKRAVGRLHCIYLC